MIHDITIDMRKSFTHGYSDVSNLVTW